MQGGEACGAQGLVLLLRVLKDQERDLFAIGSTPSHTQSDGGLPQCGQGGASSAAFGGAIVSAAFGACSFT